MTRRSGVTLVEVLVAIFVMALGLMALLTLFPLGALRMAQAIKDDRAKYAADNGLIIARVWWRDMWIDTNTNTERTYQAVVNQEPFIGALDDNTAPWRVAAPNFVPLPSNPAVAANPALTVSPFVAEPSIPVFLDPVGFITPRSLASQFWVGGDGGQSAGSTGADQFPYGTANRFGGIPRRTKVLPPPATQAAVLKMCMLPDDMEFTKNGQATDTLANGGPFFVQHYGRYKYAWMLQRDNNTFRNQVRVQVVVYYNLNTEIANNERVFLGQATSGSTAVAIYWSGEKPRIRKGGWILDSGRNIPMDVSGNFVGAVPPPAGTYPPYLRGDFYRVIGTTETLDLGLHVAMVLELQTPIRQATPGIAFGTAEPVNLIVMDNVAEVFDRNLISPVSPPQP